MDVNMSNAIWFISYKLKKDVSIEDFLLASVLYCLKKSLDADKCAT